VKVINGKPEGAVSETGAFKIYAGAALQLDGSDAVNGLVGTDGTNADAINLHHARKTAWHVSDDGRGGQSHYSPVSATGEETSAQSTSADNHFTVSSPFTATLSGNGGLLASPFKPNVDHPAAVDPGINLASVPKDQLLQRPADNLIYIPAQPPHRPPPAHPQVDGKQSANVKAADGGSAHPPHEDPSVQSTPADNGHHWGTDPEIKSASIPQNQPPEHPADNSLHTPAQDDDNSSPAAADGAHPGRGQGDRSEPTRPKFADARIAPQPHLPPHHPPAQ